MRKFDRWAGVTAAPAVRQKTKHEIFKKDLAVIIFLPPSLANRAAMADDSRLLTRASKLKTPALLLINQFVITLKSKTEAGEAREPSS
jgi:hypothetical protein